MDDLREDYVRTAGEVVLVPDTTVIYNGVLRRLIVKEGIRGVVTIPKELVMFFDNLSKEGRSLGVVALEELRLIRSLSDRYGVKLRITSINRKIDDIDVAIREYAYENGFVLVTSSRTQKLSAEILGVKVLYKEPERIQLRELEKYFAEDVMSVHLKEGASPQVKKGRPGRWVLEKVSETPITREELEALSEEIVEAAKTLPDAVIEIERRGSTIIQLGDYRIIISRPPMSSGWEITAVKPLARPKLEDYGLPEKLVKRLNERAEGIVIAGAPGMGKTTFAQALAEYYSRKGRVVKTIESPRDMKLPPQVVQYSKIYATPDELHDILLLSRPDYTIFDEMRNDEDFKLYVDLRLAGIGMVGVVHASSPIDAIQRFIGRVDIGVLPSVVDTLIFIDSGEVRKVYELDITVRLPTGLRESDLARPVVEVRDAITGDLEYEIYTFGEQTTVIPVKKVYGSTMRKNVEQVVKSLVPSARVTHSGDSIVVSIPRDEAKNLSRLKRKLRRIKEELGIDVVLELS
ncbi:MAG: ATPase, T2SS/T4P/T4SS family [Sulfolobales archaeon]|nr:ATPase, T2SS/T4P/T4SS family [Sulfolobales archaeon]